MFPPVRSLPTIALPRLARLRGLGWLAVAASLLAAGCEDSSTGSEPSPLGTWTLVGIGEPEELPAPVPPDGDELVAGTVAFEDDGTCEQTFELILASTGEESRPSYACTWERWGNTLSIERASGPDASADLESGRLQLIPLAEFPVLWYER